MARNLFEEFFPDDRKTPEGEAHYQRVRAQIDTIDSLIRAIEARRQELGWTKQRLAEEADLNPVVVRRLLTQEQPNPTIQTVVALSVALGIDLTFERRAPVTPGADARAVQGGRAIAYERPSPVAMAAEANPEDYTTAP